MRNRGLNPIFGVLMLLLGTILLGPVTMARDVTRDIPQPRVVEPRVPEPRGPEPRSVIVPRPQPPRVIDSYIGRDQDRVREAREAGQIKSFGEIKKTITRRFGGHVIGVDLDQDDPSTKNWIYRVRMLSDNGKVVVVQANAATGEVIDVKGQK
jgi:hypothetical protein